MIRPRAGMIIVTLRTIFFVVLHGKKEFMVTKVMFIGMGVKITIYTRKYPEKLFMLLKYIKLLSKHL